MLRKRLRWFVAAVEMNAPRSGSGAPKRFLLWARRLLARTSKLVDDVTIALKLNLLGLEFGVEKSLKTSTKEQPVEPVQSKIAPITIIENAIIVAADARSLEIDLREEFRTGWSYRLPREPPPQRAADDGERLDV